MASHSKGTCSLGQQRRVDIINDFDLQYFFDIQNQII